MKKYYASIEIIKDIKVRTNNIIIQNKLNIISFSLPLLLSNIMSDEEAVAMVVGLVHEKQRRHEEKRLSNAYPKFNCLLRHKCYGIIKTYI